MMKPAWYRHWHAIRLRSCKPHEAAGAAVITVLQRDDIVVASVGLREQDGEVVGLRAAIH